MRGRYIRVQGVSLTKKIRVDSGGEDKEGGFIHLHCNMQHLA